MTALTVLDRPDPRTRRARFLRHNATSAERKLWAALKTLPFNKGHFRRQAPIGPYFADFVHFHLRMIVELDGDQHGHDAESKRDKRRTTFLESQGYRVLRFWNHEVAQNCDGVVETILSTLTSPGFSPPP